MSALAVALLAAAAVSGPPDAAPAGSEALRFARSLASAGPRPAGSFNERAGQQRVAARFRAAGLRVLYDRFTVPRRGRSRNVVGVRPGRRACLRIVMAHADSVPPGPGADDNASGVGVLVALAPRLAALRPPCTVWLAATGAEERVFTGSPDHLGSLALARRVRRAGLRGRLRYALSLDEVGRGSGFLLRSPVAAPRRRVEGEILAAARRTGVPVGWRPDAGTGNSDHREFELAGMPAAKLGVAEDACRHQPCDRPDRLQRGALGRAQRLVERLLRRA